MAGNEHAHSIVSGREPGFVDWQMFKAKGDSFMKWAFRKDMLFAAYLKKSLLTQNRSDKNSKKFLDHVPNVVNTWTRRRVLICDNIYCA